jgi:hypothetical protein
MSRIVLFHAVCLSWIFFRAGSLSAAFTFLRGIANLQLGDQFFPGLMFLAAFSIPLFLLDLALESRAEEYIFQGWPGLSRVAAGAAIMLLIIIFSANSSAAFIYFQF